MQDLCTYIRNILLYILVKHSFVKPKNLSSLMLSLPAEYGQATVLKTQLMEYSIRRLQEKEFIRRTIKWMIVTLPIHYLPKLKKLLNPFQYPPVTHFFSVAPL